MQFVDKAFARRLESAEEMPQVYLAPLYQEQRPEIGAESKAVCGGHMIFAGLGSPVGRAVGLGLNRPFTAEALDEVEAFYRSHAAPSQVDLTPVHDPATFEMFKERGYGIAELNNVLWRPLGRGEDFLASAPAVEIRPGMPDEASSFADIVARSFHESADPPEGFHALLAPLFQIPNVIAFCCFRQWHHGRCRGRTGHPGAPHRRSFRSGHIAGIPQARYSDSPARSTAEICSGSWM